MTNETDRSPADQETPSASAASSAAPVSIQRKPRFALFLATAGGLGYLPKAPGTWGSLAGLALAIVPACLYFTSETPYMLIHGGVGDFFVDAPPGYFNKFVWEYIALLVFASAIGVWAANRAAEFWRQKDPGRVVIDEVSGQLLTLLLGCGIPVWWRVPELRYATLAPGLVIMRCVLNWKYLLLGFILFRVFDIWKPFPARQAESLTGGWGIMADDWVAGIYAGVGLWAARLMGL
jgi:phosphatidylglycerophosphatase A